MCNLAYQPIFTKLQACTPTISPVLSGPVPIEKMGSYAAIQSIKCQADLILSFSKSLTPCSLYCMCKSVPKGDTISNSSSQANTLHRPQHTNNCVCASYSLGSNPPASWIGRYVDVYGWLLLLICLPQIPMKRPYLNHLLSLLPSHSFSHVYKWRVSQQGAVRCPIQSVDYKGSLTPFKRQL